MMESTKSQQSWFKRKFRGAKDHIKNVKNYVRGRGKHKPPQAQPPSDDFAPIDISVSQLTPAINQSINDPMPPTAVAISNDESSDHTTHNCEASNETPHNTAHQIGNDGDRSSNSPLLDPHTHIKNSVLGTEVTTGDKIANGFKELLKPTQLWAEAYKMLEKDHREALGAYNQFLLENGHSGKTNGGKLQPGDGDWQNQIQELAREKLEENQKEKYSFQIGERNIIVRDQLQKVLGFIVSTNEVVKAAISSDPHAALAWAGVMFIFPLLKTMLQQDKDAIEGFEDILSLLVRCKVMETDFLGGSLNLQDENYELAFYTQSKIIKLYSNVYLYQISVVRHFNLSGAIRYFKDLAVSNDWKGMADKVKAAESDIRDDLQVQSNHAVNEIDKKLDDFESKAQEFSNLCKKTMASIEVIKQASNLRDLPVAHSAAFNSSKIEERRCTPGTRLEILNNLQRWIESPTGKPILWLHGMAGTGKSTIARTVATAINEKLSLLDNTRLPDNISLGATFFFQHDDAERNHADVLFTTLAHQLAYKSLGLEYEIADAIERNSSPNIGARRLKVQWDELILKPLKSLRREPVPIRLIFIIDALDECRNKETGTMKTNVQHIVQCLQQLEELSELQTRVLVTSRNESYINDAFNNQVLKIRYNEIELPKVSLDNLPGKKDDITIFLENELRKNHLNRGDGPKWPDPHDFRKLVEKAGGLFIYAAIACKFLDVEPLAKTRLDKLLKGDRNKKSPDSYLSQIYRTVLDSYTHDWTDDEKHGDHELKEILRVIVVLFIPLPVDSVAKFTQSKIPKCDIETSLNKLRAVVDLPEDPEDPIGLVHLSFREFLLDEQECKRTDFLVEPSVVHFSLFERCIEIMSCHLRMDMCELQKPGFPSAEVPPDLVQRWISPHLHYACRYWIDHLLQIWETEQAQQAMVDDGIVHKFLQKHILHWLEALSLTREVKSAVHLVDRLKSSINEQQNPELSKLLYDANCFIRFNARIIQEAPLQMYYSAILFSPTTSIIRSLFATSLDEWVLKPPAVDNSWDSDLTLEGHNDTITTIAISPDGKMIASGSKDNTIRLWEAATGIETATISTSGNVMKVTFSPDGQTIAFCVWRHSIIRLLDIRAGEISGILDNGRYGLQSLAFSPCLNSDMLASVSTGILDLWDISTKKIVHMHKAPETYVFGGPVAFSPDGTLVAAALYTVRYSGQSGSTVCIWDVTTGQIKATVECESIGSIAFSPDATVVALGGSRGLLTYHIETGTKLEHKHTSGDCTLSPIWGIYADVNCTEGSIDIFNVESRTVIGKVRSIKPIGEITLFHDGKAIAYISNHSTIRLSDITVSDEVSDEDTDVGGERSGFRNMISYHGRDTDLELGEEDVIIWNLEECEIIKKIPFKPRGCSPDSRILATYDSAKSGQIMWDMATGEQLVHLPNAGSKRYSVFSPKGDFVAVCSETGNEIQIWETASWNEQARFRTESVYEQYIKFSEDSKVLQWIADRFLHLGNLQTGECYRIACEDNPRPTFSPDSKLVAFRPQDAAHCIHLLQLDTREVKTEIWQDECYRVTHISFSPDSACIGIVAQRRDFSERAFFLRDTTTGNVLDTVKLDFPTNKIIRNVKIAPNGQVAITIFSGGSRVAVWDPVVRKWSDQPIHYIHWDTLYFSDDSKYLEGHQGRLPLSSSFEDFSCLYVDNDWVLQGRERLLWLPSKYRTGEFNIAVLGGTIMLALQPSSPVFIKIDLEKTPLAKSQRAPS